MSIQDFSESSILSSQSQKEQYSNLETISNEKDSNNFQEKSQDFNNYWSWGNILKKQVWNNQKQKTNPNFSKNKPYIKKNDEEKQINQCQSIGSQKMKKSSSQENDKITEITKKLQTLQLKWSKTSSIFWQQTLQKLLSPIKAKTKSNWKDCQGWIKQGKIIYMSQHFKIQDISKIKILPEVVNNNSQYCEFKFVYFNQAIVIGLPIYRFFQQYQLHFAWFIAIIVSKLKQKGYERKGEIYIPKSTKSNKEPIKHYGKIFKKSQYLGNWAQRKILINEEGIFTCHLEQNFDKKSFCISKSSIKYIWTRFEIYQKEYIIIKIKHGIKKTEIAIPINDIFKRKLDLIFSIYQLMMKF